MSDLLFRPKTGGHDLRTGMGTWLAWILVGFLSLVIVVMLLLFAHKKPAKPQAAWQVPQLGKDVQYSVVANTAADFMANLIHFTSAGYNDHLQYLLKMCDAEYAQNLQLVVENPALAELIKQKSANIATTIDEPRILAIKEGKILVAVSGKITVTSASQTFGAISRYYKATLTLINVKGTLKVTNVIWQLADLN